VLEAEGAAPVPRPEFVVAPLGAAAEREALALAHRLRRGGARVDVEAHARSLKSQMRHADKLGARYVIIIGDDELAGRTITVRDMAAKLDRQRVAHLDTTLSELRAALAEPLDSRLERHA